MGGGGGLPSRQLVASPWVVFNTEVLEKGPNTRFVVTDHPQSPLVVYDTYADRGECENRMKEFKNAPATDRLSDHRFWANQLRLRLHAAADWPLDILRRWLTGTDSAHPSRS